MEVIILAGGQGNRMDDILPKPLIKVKDKPILAWQLDYILKFPEVKKIVLSLCFKAEQIIDFVKANYPDQAIDFVVENEPLGTGGALKLALGKIQSDFVVVMNCDDLTDIALKALKKVGDNTICVAHPRLPFGLVNEENGWAKFEEKPVLKEWVSCGWYLFKRQELLSLLPDKGSMEYEIFPKLKFKLFKHEGFWRPLNTKKDLLEFETA